MYIHFLVFRIFYQTMSKRPYLLMHAMLQLFWTYTRIYWVREGVGYRDAVLNIHINFFTRLFLYAVWTGSTIEPIYFPFSLFSSYWKWNFPELSCPSVGQLVCWSVIISCFTFPAPFGALFYYLLHDTYLQVWRFENTSHRVMKSA